MDQFPLYPYYDDPLRILSPRRIREELPAAPPDPPPPDPPPPGEGTHPHDGGGAPPETPGAAPSDDPPVPPHADGSRRDPAPPAGEEAERPRLVHAWVDKHWDLLEAMARADETPQRPPPPPPDPDPAEEAARAARIEARHTAPGDRWNKHKMVAFLRQLAATQSVAEAACSVGMSRSSAYRLRNRLKGQPFDIAWEAAFRQGYDNLAHAALDRALNGVEVPHYHHGELVGTSRKYDERLTLGLLTLRNRAGAPMLGRFGAAAEYWGDNWDRLLERIETGPVDWSAEHAALGEEERERLGLPDAERDLMLLIARNTPDDRGGGPAR